MELDDADNSSISNPLKTEFGRMEYIGSTRNTSLDIFNFSIKEAASILQDYMRDDEGSRKVAILSGYAIMIFAGIFTNLLVSLTIICNSRLRVSGNLLIVNLGLSDLMCIFCMPFTVVELLNRSWNLGSFLCRSVTFIQGVTIFVSSATVSAIAIDRQHVIIHFKNSRSNVGRGNNNILIYIFFIWFFSVLLSLPILFSKKIQHVTVGDMFLYEKCIEQWSSYHARAMYTIVIIVVQLFIPGLVLTVTYLRIKRHLNRCVGKHDEKNSPRTSVRLQKALKRNNKATTVLSFISVVFVFSWLPWNIFNFMADFGYLPDNMSADHLSLIFTVCHLVAMSSSVTNPILYGWFNSNVKRQLRQIPLVAVRQVFLSSKGMKTEKSNESVLYVNTYIRSTAKKDLRESQL